MKRQHILIFMGIYYLVSALWPLIHISSFEAVTGRKRNHWLVYTVASLLLVSSVVYLYTGLKSTALPIETMILFVGNALALTIIDIVFVFLHKIRKIYLLDASVEMLLIILLMTCDKW
jgi:hypothetical protein